MMFLRALVFNVVFFGLTTLMSVAGIGVRIFARQRAFAFARLWAGIVVAAARTICGIHAVWAGERHLPQCGPALLACQHQSAFDTLIWMGKLPRTSYVVKRELTQIPLFGPLLQPAGMIVVDRAAGAAALRALVQATLAAKQAGRQIVIFPEGTRAPPGQIAPLQPGIAAIAARLDLPVIPVATDSGRRWGRRAFRKLPGPIHITIGPPIPAGTPRRELLDAIEAFWRQAAASDHAPVDKSVGITELSLANTMK